MSSHRPTMKDVAARAGVALKTVSRVVNGESGVTPAGELVMGRLAGNGEPPCLVEPPAALISRGSAGFPPQA